MKIAFGRSRVMVASMSNWSLISLKMVWILAFVVSLKSAGNCVSSWISLNVIPWSLRINAMVRRGLMPGPVSSMGRLAFLRP